MLPFVLCTATSRKLSRIHSTNHFSSILEVFEPSRQFVFVVNTPKYISRAHT